MIWTLIDFKEKCKKFGNFRCPIKKSYFGFYKLYGILSIFKYVTFSDARQHCEICKRTLPYFYWFHEKNPNKGFSNSFVFTKKYSYQLKKRAKLKIGTTIISQRFLKLYQFSSPIYSICTVSRNLKVGRMRENDDFYVKSRIT